ncbi:melatonin receptor type 1C-like [Oculina patagonica]
MASNFLGSRSLALVILEGSSLVVLNIFSLIGNVLVCLSVYRNPRLRTSTNLYIIALAVSDLLSAVFVMPLAEVILFLGEWPFGDIICQLHAFISLFVIYVSPATMSLTAVNRYVRICRSSTIYKKIFSPRKSRFWLAFIWFCVACYIAIPRLANWQGFEFVPGYAQCSIKHLGENVKIIHYSVVITLFLALPLFATVICYAKVLKSMRQHNMAFLRRNEARITVQEIKLSRSLFIVVFTFMSCWIPLWIIVILRRFFITIYIPRNVELLCMFFLYISNTINPLIYSGMNSAFRSEFRRIITCRSSGLVSSQCSQRRNQRHGGLEQGGFKAQRFYRDGVEGIQQVASALNRARPTV